MSSINTKCVLGVMLFLVVGCGKPLASKPAQELPRYRNAVITITDVQDGTSGHGLLYMFGETNQPRFQEAKPSFGSHRGDLFHCDAQWQYLATTQHGDVYEVVIDASKLKDTPPTIVRRVAYNNAPLLLFENAVVKITLHPDAQSASTLPK